MNKERTEKRFEKGETVRYVEDSMSVLLTDVHCHIGDVLILRGRDNQGVNVEDKNRVFRLEDSEGVKNYLHASRTDLQAKLDEIHKSLWAIKVMEHNLS